MTFESITFNQVGMPPYWVKTTGILGGCEVFAFKSANTFYGKAVAGSARKGYSRNVGHFENTGDFLQYAIL